MSAATRAEEIFLRVVELIPVERARVLDELCPDGESRAEVERLLAADSGAPAGFLAGAEAGAPGVDGERIGPYRILERLGEGGMGTVYAAHQSFPERVVALKVLRSGHVTAQAIRRFRHEIDILGRLQHSGIARIYDAGSIATPGIGGAPRELHYFTMELVRGVPLLRFAGENELGRPQRLELLARTCDAVHYAHQRGVIHRDLKSENVLVTTEESTADAEPGELRRRAVGQPKVLDFGIARLVDPGLEGVTRQTKDGALLGTLGAMSPEQVSGDTSLVDVRTDVYALGVMLYELLCGRAPIPLEGLAVPQAIQRILEEEPAPPGSLDPELRGDLSTIALKALEKDPERRYQTAAELAADLRSFLRGEPIAARSDSRLYVLRRSIRRHRWMVAFATTVAVLVGAFALYSLRQAGIQAEFAESEAAARRQAEADYLRALEALDLLTDLGSRGLVDIPQAEPARRALLEASLAFHLDLLEAHPEKEELVARQARTRVRVATLLDALGERDEALEEIARATAELEDELAAAGEPELEARLAHLDSLSLHGGMLRRGGRNEEARERLERSVSIAEALEAGTAPGDPRRGLVLERSAFAHRQLAECLAAEGRREEAADFARASFERLEASAATLEPPRLQGDLEGQLLSLLQVAAVRRLDEEPRPELEADLLRLIEGFRALRERRPDSGDLRQALVSLHTNYSTALTRWGRIEEASEQLELAIELGEDLFGAHPDLETSSQHLFNAYHNRGNRRAKAGELEGAEADLQRAAVLLERMLKLHEGPDLQTKLAFLENTRAGILIRQDRHEEAIEDLESARRHAEAVLQAVPSEPRMLLVQRYTLVNQGIACARLGRPGEASACVARLSQLPAEGLGKPEIAETLWVWRRSLELVRDDPALPEDARAELDERICEGALEYLRAAERGGFRGWGELREDFEWGALLEFPPLAELVDGLAAR